MIFNNNNVTQSNKLITSSYDISLQEKRLILAILGKYKQSELPKECTITAAEFGEIFQDFTIDYYQALNKAVDLLYERDIRYLNGRKNKQRFRWVQYIEYDELNSQVILKWSDDMLPLISELTQEYTNYKLIQVSKLTTVYSMRIFELIQEKSSFGEFSISVDDFKHMFQIEGKYKRFNNLKARVINPALKEILEVNDLKVNFKASKMGRFYNYLTFTWDKKAKNIPPSLKITKVTNLEFFGDDEDDNQASNGDK